MNGSSIGRVALWIAAAALLAHAGLFAGGVWSFGPINYDDPQVLSILEQDSLWDLLTTETWYAYKPLYFGSLKIDWFLGERIFDGAAVGFGHFVNLLLHGLAAFLLVKLLFDIFGSVWIAGAAGLLFAVHPAHVENVAWFSERKDVLSLVFVLLAHRAYRSGRDADRKLLLAPAVLLLLGGLTKGTVWSYAGILTVDEVVHTLRLRAGGGQATWGLALRRVAPLWVVALGGIALDLAVAAGSGAAGIEHGVSTPSLMAAMAGVHLRYLLHLLVPVHLALDYAIDPAGSWGSLLSIGGLVLALAALGALVLGIRRARPVLAWSAAFWIFGLAPVNNVWPTTAALMADRYLYVPAIGLYVLLAALLRRAGAVRGVALGAIAVALFALAELRTGAFASSERIWTDTLEKVPESALAHLQRGVDAVGRGRFASGLQDADAALERARRPELRVRARLLRCGALYGLRRIEDLLTEANAATNEARALTRDALVRDDPRAIQAQAEIFRGQAQEALHDRAAALDAYAKAARLDPDNWSAWFNQGTMLATGRSPEALDDAIDALRRARDLAPDRLEIELQLATVHGRRGDRKRALAVLDRAAQKHGTDADLLYTRATVMLEVANDWAEARNLLRTLRDIDPDHPKGKRLEADIEVAIGRASLKKGRAERERKLLSQAVDHFDAALRILPDHWQAHVFAGDAFAEQGRYREARRRYHEAREDAPGERWIAGVIARTGALEAALVAHRGTEPEQVLRAARVMGGAIGLEGVGRIDLGFAPLQDELRLLRELPPLIEKGQMPEAAHAAELLAAAALLVTGDELTALGRLHDTLGRLGGSERSTSLLDAALVLRAMLYERQTEFALARQDYELLQKRRPDDVLPPLRILQLELRTAEARRRTAAGHDDDPQHVAAAQRAVERAAERVRAFADAHPDSASAGMLAVQAEINLQRWIEALRRLNALKERFPGHPSVYRGYNAVYVAEYTQTRERGLIEEASRALRIATDLDPRDARTAMDASQLARVAGDLQSALKHAERARALESYAGGQASRMLGDLQVELGYKALEGGQVEQARQAVAAARRVDPKRAGSWVLEGEIALKSPSRDRFVRAYELAKRAKELEPYHPDVNRLLAKCHKGSATTALLHMGRYRVPRPGTKAYEALQALPEEERAKRIEQIESFRERYRQQAISDLDMALMLDPTAEDAADTRRQLRMLQASSRENLMEREQLARKAYERGIRLLVDERYVDALYAFHDAVRHAPRFKNAHGRLVESAVKLLDVLVADDPEALKTARKYEEMAWRSFYVLESLDLDRSVAELYFLRGELSHFKFRTTSRAQAEARNVARLAAVAAYEHYVLRARARGTEPSDSPPLRRALARLASLRKQD